MEKAKPITKAEHDEMLKIEAEQKKIANSILDSVYSKLLSPDATTETILQMMLDAGLTPEGRFCNTVGFEYLIGSLSIKITENFLNGKEINSQQYHKALEILKSLDEQCGTSFEMFDEYAEESHRSSGPLGYPIRACVINMAVRKLKQECSNFSELFKILDELGLREND